MTVDAAELRQAVLGKGLMDEAFYRSNYGERIAPGEPAIDHFVRLGHELGYAPCAAFDPVLHQMLNGPTPPSQWPDRAEAEGAERQGSELFPDINFQLFFWDFKSDEELKANMGEFLTHPTRPVKLPSPYGVYKFRNPPSAEVFDAIRAGRPFAFLRIPHGFWDSCNALDRVSDGLAADPRTAMLSEARRRALGVRLLASRSPNNGNFAGDFLDTILEDLRDHPRETDLLTGVSFKGTPTYEDSAFGLGPPRPAHLERAGRFMQLFSPCERLYDAMVWKRWAILGGLKDLPHVLRERPLVLVARKSYGVLAERLRWPHLVLVDIPKRKTQLIRHEVLARIEAVIQWQLDRHPGQTPVVLLQSGASLGYWFIRRLRPKFPEVIYLDIGEALNIWCLDLDGHNLWLEPYRDQVLAACDIEPAGQTSPS